MADSRLILIFRPFLQRMDTGPDTIKLNKLANLNIFVTRSSRHFFSCCEEAIRLVYIASVLCVSPPVEHISLLICVRGNTYHGETHITVTGTATGTDASRSGKIQIINCARQAAKIQTFCGRPRRESSSFHVV